MNHFNLLHQFINSDDYKSRDWIPIINKHKPLGLSYSHLYHSIHFNNAIESFQDKNILELGGALPSQYVFQILKANTWTALEYLGYDDNQLDSHNSVNSANYTYDNKGWNSFYENWKIRNGDKFDIVYSISAFEHIYDLGRCIDSIYEMLNPGGKLYSFFTPIWSATNGSHGFFPKFVSPGNSHEHLMQDFVSLQELLINTHGISAFQAYEYAHAVYKSDQINRFTYEEYIHIFNHSKFESKRIFPLNLKKIKDLYEQNKYLIISKKYPNMIHSCDGFAILFAKNM